MHLGSAVGCKHRSLAGPTLALGFVIASMVLDLERLPCSGAETTAETSAPSQAEQLKQLDQELHDLMQQEQIAQEEWVAKRRTATDAERFWQSMLGELEQIALQQRDLEQTLKSKQKELDEAAAKQKEAMAATTAARQAVEEAQKRLAEAEANAKKAAAAEDAAKQPINELSTQLTTLVAKIEPLKSSAAKAKQQAAPVQQSVLDAEARLNAITDARRTQQEKIESFLRQTGQWISFSEQIAPIFHQRCVACHNARNAQGRYNMATFDAIHSVGESGPAIVPGDADESRLVQMIEDGSMPLDADPLSDEQITLVRRWIELGARLESNADPDSPLVRLLPRVPQPMPPQVYRAAMPVTALAVNADGTLVASSGYHELLIWTAASGTLARRIPNLAQRVYGLAFHPDGQRLAVASGTPGQLGEVKLFDANSGELLGHPVLCEDVVYEVEFSPDGDRLAACGADGSIALIATNDLERAPQFIEDHSDWVNDIAWSPDGKRLVSASRDKTAKVFDADTGKLLITFNKHEQNVTTVLFTPDSKQVISGGNDGKLRVWKVTDATETIAISGLPKELTDLHLLSGDRVVSVGSDSQLRVYRFSEGKILADLNLPAPWISSLTVSNDEQTLFCGDQAGEIHRIRFDDKLHSEQSWVAVPQQQR